MVQRIARVLAVLHWRQVLTESQRRAIGPVEGYVNDSWPAHTQGARDILATMREPTKTMAAAGDQKAADCIDSDWDSGPDGEGSHTFERLRSDAPGLIYTAMIDAELGQN